MYRPENLNWQCQCSHNVKDSLKAQGDGNLIINLECTLSKYTAIVGHQTTSQQSYTGRTKVEYNAQSVHHH